MATNPFFDELSQFEDIIQGPLLSSPTDPLTDITDPKEQVKQNFRILLLTAPGERLTDSNFGVGLKNYLLCYSISYSTPPNWELQFAILSH